MFGATGRDGEDDTVTDPRVYLVGQLLADWMRSSTAPPGDASIDRMIEVADRVIERMRPKPVFDSALDPTICACGGSGWVKGPYPEWGFEKCAICNGGGLKPFRIRAAPIEEGERH